MCGCVDVWAACRLVGSGGRRGCCDGEPWVCVDARSAAVRGHVPGVVVPLLGSWMRRCECHALVVIQEHTLLIPFLTFRILLRTAHTSPRIQICMHGVVEVHTVDGTAFSDRCADTYGCGLVLRFWAGQRCGTP
jgi:hypothetical protein